MMKSSSVLFVVFLLSACSFYSSTGRKQFEEKAPNQIALQTQGVAFLGCHDVGSAEAWLHSEFPPVSTEIIESTEQHEVWGRLNSDQHFEVSVLTEQQTGMTKSCRYIFASVQDWNLQQKEFLSSLTKLEQPQD